MEVEVDVSGQVKTECVCPKCGHRFHKKVNYHEAIAKEIDLSDYAHDCDWRD